MSLSVVGHRGASAAEPPGNTIAAFRRAAELGADWVELDARRTADDAVVVHHDAELPDGRVIRSVPAAELTDWVPTLEAALDACDGMKVNVEIKNSPDDPDFDESRSIADAVVDVLGQRDRSGFLITSFDAAALERVRVVDRHVPLGLLEWNLQDPRAVLDRASSLGCAAINPWDGFVDASLVRDAHALGLEVNVWTVNDPDRMRQLAELGVAGIITDVPDVARQVVDGRAR